MTSSRPVSPLSSTSATSPSSWWPPRSSSPNATWARPGYLSRVTASRERYWRESGEKLPATREMHPPKLIRGLFDWYYTRIYVHVRPERVFVWGAGDVTSPPDVLGSRMDEVRSGHIEEPLEPHAP